MTTKLSRASVGLAVRTARETAKLTANDLSKLANMTPSSLSRTENALRALEFDEAVAICRALNIQVEQLRTLAETFEYNGATANRSAQKQLEGDLVRLQRIALEAAIEASN